MSGQRFGANFDVHIDVVIDDTGYHIYAIVVYTAWMNLSWHG